MSLLEPSDRRFAVTLSRLAYCNPFLPERIALEREALGDQFVEADSDWNVQIESGGVHPNVERLRDRAAQLAQQCRDQLVAGAKASRQELIEYEALVLFSLYHRTMPQLEAAIRQAFDEPDTKARITFYNEFVRDLNKHLQIAGVQIPTDHEPAHLFAFFFQIRRAFHHIFYYIIGASQPTVRLRAAVWQSIFTHDMQRYRRSLYRRMGDITTLVTGPSGTGKELVARAVGLSRYIPFDPKTQTFTEHFVGAFMPINLSALSPTLIESELFGHKRGAFTGALQDRVGYLEACPPLGAVFLDEIGDIDVAIQVKLLRVLQSRTFQRLGETESRPFRGKLIVATNRNLANAIRTGGCREDFYYRLCSDVIVTPSLRDQLSDVPDELQRLVHFVARRIAGKPEADALTDEVVTWIEQNLGRDCAWPGNVRELEQCVRNVMIRQAYCPARAESRDEVEELLDGVRDGQWTADELLNRYCKLIHTRTGNYLETARRLNIDRRTVKRRVAGDS